MRSLTSYEVKYKHAAGPEPTNATPMPRYSPRNPSFLHPIQFSYRFDNLLSKYILHALECGSKNVLYGSRLPPYIKGLVHLYNPRPTSYYTLNIFCTLQLQQSWFVDIRTCSFDLTVSMGWKGILATMPLVALASIVAQYCIA